MFEQFFSMPMGILCLVIWVLVLLQRKVIELALPRAKTSLLWRELFLPFGPPGTGALFGIVIANYPYPDVFVGSLGGRICCGVVCGLASGFAYRLLKNFFMSKGVPADSLSNDSLDKSE